MSEDRHFCIFMCGESLYKCVGVLCIFVYVQSMSCLLAHLFFLIKCLSKSCALIPSGTFTLSDRKLHTPILLHIP